MGEYGSKHPSAQQSFPSKRFPMKIKVWSRVRVFVGAPNWVLRRESLRENVAATNRL